MKKMVNESLKDELIARLLTTVFKDESIKDAEITIKYLENLTLDELDELITTYNLHDIKHQKK